MDMNVIELRDNEHKDPKRLRRRSTAQLLKDAPQQIAPKEHVVKVN